MLFYGMFLKNIFTDLALCSPTILGVNAAIAVSGNPLIAAFVTAVSYGHGVYEVAQDINKSDEQTFDTYEIDQKRIDQFYHLAAKQSEAHKIELLSPLDISHEGEVLSSSANIESEKVRIVKRDNDVMDDDGFAFISGHEIAHIVFHKTKKHNYYLDALGDISAIHKNTVLVMSGLTAIISPDIRLAATMLALSVGMHAQGLVAKYYSRQREYDCDLFSAKLSGDIKGAENFFDQTQYAKDSLKKTWSALMKAVKKTCPNIEDPKNKNKIRKKIESFYHTHPSDEDRMKALENALEKGLVKSSQINSLNL